MELLINPMTFNKEERALFNKIIKNWEAISNKIITIFDNRQSDDEWHTVKGVTISIDDGDGTVCLYPIKKINNKYEPNMLTFIEVQVDGETYVCFEEEW
jgi:hypothetical protein